MIFLVSQLFGPVRVILVSFRKTQQKVFKVQRFDESLLMLLPLKEETTPP